MFLADLNVSKFNSSLTLWFLRSAPIFHRYHIRAATTINSRYARCAFARLRSKRKVQLVVPDQLVALCQSVAAVARLRVRARVFHHSRPHRIEFDVAVAQQQVLLGIHQTRLEASLPQGPASLVDAIHVLHVPPSQALHEPGDAVLPLRAHEQVHVVRHEHVGVQVAAVLVRALPEPVQIEAIVLLRKEAGLPVVAALHYVQRNLREIQAWSAGHCVGPGSSCHSAFAQHHGMGLVVKKEFVSEHPSQIFKLFLKVTQVGSRGHA